MTHKSPKENAESRTPTKSRPKKSNRHQLMGLRFLLALALRRQKHAIPTAESTRPQLDNHHELPTQNKKNCASPAADGSPSPATAQTRKCAEKGQRQSPMPCKLVSRRWGAIGRVASGLGVRLSPDLALDFNPGAAVRAPIWIALKI